MRLIVDSHLDLALNAVGFNRDLTDSLDRINRREAGMTDGPCREHATVCFDEMRRGGVAVCLGSLLVRTNADRQVVLRREVDFCTQEIAYAMAQGQLAYYRAMETRGQIRLIRSAGELDEHWARWEGSSDDRRPIGLIVAMEGADGIVSPSLTEAWWNDGLRVVSLVHYGHGIYADGTGCTGGLTPRGEELLGEIERLGMVLDATHLSERGFFQVMESFGGVVLASHNNSRSLVPGDRQFSDEQVRALVERDGVIGVAMDNWMLYPNYQRGRSPRELVHLSDAADHIDAICQLAGNCRHVGIGSDLDGGYGSEQTPADLDTIADLQALDVILAERGYSDEDLDAVFHGNLLRLLRRGLPR